MKSYFNCTFIVMLLLLLGACQSNTTDNEPPVTSTTINDFGVVGNTPQADARIVLPLQPNNATVSGSFTLFWDAISSNPYTMEVYMSTDAALDPTTDTLFLRMQCGSDQFAFICDQFGAIVCGIAYEPLYQMVQDVDEQGNPLTYPNGDPIMVPEKDSAGNYIVLQDRYFLRCADGPATERVAEITDRITGFPFSSYFIFTACATDEVNCPVAPVSVEFFDAQP